MDSLEMNSQELAALETKLERLVIEHFSKIKEENKKLKEENENQKQIIEIQQNLKNENERLKRAIHMHGAHMGMCVRYHNRGGIAGPGEWEDLK